MRTFSAFWRGLGAAFAAAALAAGLWDAAQAQASYPPRQDAAINDFAGVLGAGERAAVMQARQALLDARGAELVVATIGSVEEYDQSDRSFEAFATGLFNSWGIGDSQRNDGVLLLVAVRDRRVRIELGSGFGSQHNAAMQVVIDQAIVPEMRAGNYGAGVVAGVRGIEAALLGAPAAEPTGLRALLGSPAGLLGVGVALAGIAGTAYAFWRELRSPRRRCARCGAGMRRMKSPADQAELNPAQRMELQLQSASYVVWECRRCASHEPERSLRPSSPLDTCPACHYRTLQITSQSLPARKTKGRKRQAERRTERECLSCGFKDHRTETLAQAASAASYAVADRSYDSSSSTSYDYGSSSSSYDSSSSSTSYDYGSSSSDSGGSSSGDGASGSW